MRRISLIPFLAALGLAACASRQAAHATHYVTPAAVYIPEAAAQAVSLAPPPAAGSAEDSRDLATLRQWQDKRSPQECARAAAEMEPGYESVFGAISPFPRPMPADAAEFFDQKDVGPPVAAAMRVLGP